MLNIIILWIAINNSIVLSVLFVAMFTETERRLHEHRQKSAIWYIFCTGVAVPVVVPIALPIKDLIQVVHFCSPIVFLDFTWKEFYFSKDYVSTTYTNVPLATRCYLQLQWDCWLRQQIQRLARKILIMRSFENGYMLQSQNVRFNLFLLIPNRKIFLTILNEIYFIAPKPLVGEFSAPPPYDVKIFHSPPNKFKKISCPP